MANLHFVNLDEKSFSIIINNQYDCIGVINGNGNDFNLEALEKFRNSFVSESLCVESFFGIESFFDNQHFPTRFKKGDYVVLSREDGWDWLDDIGCRITVLIDDVHHFHSRINTSDEINVLVYAYSLLTPEHFFDSADHVIAAYDARRSVSAGVCE
ncbi:hypothetical protein [Xenorhabdus doucetiae]|uniref:Uncharacterized protein n=1 Tax=Xenorhabdus doucetiae TaxID=351671 RepID=A0A068QU62_9GAMM|nr:hypothetical protein [Xenorhabdus doucetiae]CDG18562.1 protein of unknown function [Xenorhabdus doucetiae]